ncbi:unnamed protein product [Hermetia illucens]|uniref:tRNA-5-taurinomethyluridine 2-sulfurtransferase n=2 Tax=Hermetia illucens TaxID=343691 RepID=A0A7R8UW28_HERIL|nr:unnamed protein product [Hermetia illucens]
MAFRKVLLAVSGGIDSAVAGHLLKSKGYEVIGAFMKNWDDFDELGACSGEHDWHDAQIVCRKLGIPLIQVNFVKHYWNKVFGEFLSDYENGLTPNPDILCNRYIKFDEFFNYAMNTLKVDAIATGHYARTSFGPYLENYTDQREVRLLQAFDKFKDQTFFLSQVRQNALRRTMFPIGTFLKREVKEFAQAIGLDNVANKPESTGICFIGDRNFQSFINEYIAPRLGNFVDIDTGQVVGNHNGIHCWTIGQRCRISGCLKPYYVARKDVSSNVIYVASGTDHPSLHTQDVFTGTPFWIRETAFGSVHSLTCKFRFQHTKPLVDCTIYQSNDEQVGLYVKLHEPLRAITPGQYAVFYLDEECLGAARITQPLNFENRYIEIR